MAGLNHKISKSPPPPGYVTGMSCEFPPRYGSLSRLDGQNHRRQLYGPVLDVFRRLKYRFSGVCCTEMFCVQTFRTAEILCLLTLTVVGLLCSAMLAKGLIYCPGCYLQCFGFGFMIYRSFTNERPGRLKA